MSKTIAVIPGVAAIHAQQESRKTDNGRGYKNLAHKSSMKDVEAHLKETGFHKHSSSSGKTTYAGYEGGSEDRVHIHHDDKGIAKKIELHYPDPGSKSLKPKMIKHTAKDLEHYKKITNY